MLTLNKYEGKHLETLKNKISDIYKIDFEDLYYSIRELNKLNLRLEIDVNNYKERKLKIFKKEIEDICNSVINTKVEVKLDPMNSYKRRIVHSIVSNYKSLTSFSVLDEPNRYTIIKFKD